MLRVAPDPSDKPRELDEIYPGRIVKPVVWEKCLDCKNDVDAYIYYAGQPHGYCFNHYLTYAKSTA
jgi:hypothetical protein